MEHSDLLRLVADVCDRLHLTYFITGSTATIFYGEPRFTLDIDVVIDLPPDRIGELVSAFPRDEFYLSTNAVSEAVRRRSQFNLIHPTSGLQVDFIVLSDSEFDHTRMLRRRELETFTDRTVSFASPEDVILKKMLYFREGGSEKHLRDIAGVLRVQGEKIDRGYIAGWAKRFDLTTIWDSIVELEKNGR